MSIEKSRDELFTLEEPIQVFMLLNDDVQGKFFDSNLVKMGVKTLRWTQYEDGKLLNDTKLVSIEKSREKLLTSEQRIYKRGFDAKKAIKVRSAENLHRETKGKASKTAIQFEFSVRFRWRRRDESHQREIRLAT